MFYDFGCVKRLDPTIVQANRDTIRAGFAEDYAGVEDGLLRLGARVPDGPPVPFDYYKMWRNIFLAPFLGLPCRFRLCGVACFDGLLERLAQALNLSAVLIGVEPQPLEFE